MVRGARARSVPGVVKGVGADGALGRPADATDRTRPSLAGKAGVLQVFDRARVPLALTRGRWELHIGIVIVGTSGGSGVDSGVIGVGVGRTAGVGNEAAMEEGDLVPRKGVAKRVGDAVGAGAVAGPSATTRGWPKRSSLCEVCDARRQRGAAAPPPPGLFSRSTMDANAAKILICSWLIFFVLYANVALIAPFFPASNIGKMIGSSAIGIVFAAYPLATALCIPLPPIAIGKIGTRATIVVGLLLCSLTSLMAAYVPDTLGPDVTPHTYTVVLFSLRFATGVGAALSGAGCFTAISTGGFGDKLGLVMSTVELVIGGSAAGGSIAGGTLYKAGVASGFGGWELPFVASAAAVAALVPLTLLLIPDAEEEEDEVSGEGSDQPLWTMQRIASLCSLFIGAGLMECLLPILGPHTAPPPLSLDEAGVGVLFALFSFSYMLVALPCGMLADTIGVGPSTGRNLKSMLLVGWIIMTCAMGVLAQAGVFASLDGLTSMRASLLMQGVGSGLIIVPSLPELQYSIPESDEASKAVLCSVWNGMYAAAPPPSHPHHH